MPNFKQFLLPDVGEGLMEAEILSWKVKPGDTVATNQVIVEIETAKAAVELPSPFSGVVADVLVDVGTTVDVGTAIISIDVDPGGATAETEGVANLVGFGPKASTARRRARMTPPVVIGQATAPEKESVPLAKPPVRLLAKQLGVDLRGVKPTKNGVISRADVEKAAQPATPVVVTQTRATRRVPIKGVRKATATAMTSSAFTAPHVTEFLTVDVTPMMELRSRLKENPRLVGKKLTPLTFVAKAVCVAAKHTPEITSVWDEAAGEIVFQDFVHLGIAAATPRGLVVPKVRDADLKTLPELADSIEDLTETARAGKTSPADMLGGTFTITNLGVFGIDTGTPIINPGESAILAVGTISDRPWVVDGQLAVRKICTLALSFDHRVIDGQQGSEFLANVGAIFANPELAITY